MKTLYFILRLILVLASVSTLVGCATTATGRQQLILMPADQINQMGITAFQDLKAAQKILTTGKNVNYINCITQAMTHTFTNASWEVVLFVNDSPNAFALPGNKIGIHSGLITLTDNPDQLAAVIGHEISHVLARHSNERLSQKFALQQGLMLSSKISAPNTQLGKTALSLLGLGGHYGIILPFSRLHEQEADILGLTLMAKAGFDPQQSINLWHKMAQANKQHVSEFLSTHPSYHHRIEILSQHMPTALVLREKAKALDRNPHCTP
ncbi:MAG: M48 family metallopeptidase [Methylococcales bacterium]|jgi:predicted Zn-dependent protease|nr:M48 family metallopeptidase [Methylococcales bacterium]